MGLELGKAPGRVGKNSIGRGDERDLFSSVIQHVCDAGIIWPEKAPGRDVVIVDYLAARNAHELVKIPVIVGKHIKKRVAGLNAGKEIVIFPRCGKSRGVILSVDRAAGPGSIQIRSDAAGKVPNGIMLIKAKEDNMYFFHEGILCGALLVLGKG